MYFSFEDRQPTEQGQNRCAHEFWRVSVALEVLFLHFGQGLVHRWSPLELPNGLFSRLGWRLEQGEKLAYDRVGYEAVGRYGKVLLDAHLDRIGFVLLPLKLQKLVVRDLVLGLPSFGVARRVMLICQTTRSPSCEHAQEHIFSPKLYRYLNNIYFATVTRPYCSSAVPEF